MDESYNRSFPSGYVETSIELPEDGLNGECIVHFGGNHSNDELAVPLVNGTREGKAILFHDGLPTLKYMYRNGVLTGDVEMVEEWERLLLIMSKGINSEDSLFSYDIETKYLCGVMKYSNRYYSVYWCMGTYRMVIADVNTKEMIIYENRYRIDSQYIGEVIDLNVNGRRWEGGMKDGKPLGYGVMYDEEGKKEYEGFMMDGKKMCYGMEYSNDTERVRYRGCFYNGKRCGKGVLYNRNGMVDYDGLWKNDKPSTLQFDGLTIDNYTESIEIVNNSFKEVESFIPPFFLHSLKRIVIGDECFGKVRVFELNGLGELESVVIGKRCFSMNSKEPWNSERNDGVCSIMNCLKLEFIHIGDYSLGDYHSFELNNLPSLQSIDIGEYCFYWSPSFSLTGLIGLLL